MDFSSLVNVYEGIFVINLILSFIAGFFIGAEREARGKDAGISTHSFVISGSMLFTMISLQMDPSSPARIAAQIVTGVGFLGAGIILKGNDGKITNLTTAASLWSSAAIGMALGFQLYIIATIATIFSIVIPRVPHITGELHMHDR